MSAIATKFLPPLEPIHLLDRPRLRERLVEAERHRMTVVKAPAGYGKTTLIAQWRDELRARGEVAAWLTLDRRERDAKNLISSMAAMMAGDSRFGARLDAIFINEAAFNIDGMIATLVERIAAIEGPVTFFLDDAHVMGAEAAAAFAELQRCAPHNARFVLATRETRRLELGALRAYGRLFEIGPQDLRFTAPEAAALFACAGHRDLDPAHIDALVEKTEGWVTGLKLAALALSRDGGADMLATFSGRRCEVADFFAEDIFARQSANVCSFLLDTAVLDRLSPALCDAMTGRSDSTAMLRHLEEIGLFIVALDEERGAYRYHSLFSEFLRRKLAETDADATARLHRRASQWFADQNSFVEALDHALRASDFPLLASLLEEVAEEFTYLGRLGIVARFASHLPEEILANSPWTLVSVAWLKIRALRFSESRRLLDMALRRLAEMRSEPGCDAAVCEALEQMIAHREMMLAVARDDVSHVEDDCGRLMRYFESRRPYIACTLHAQTMIARREQFRFDGLERRHAHGCATAQQSGYRFAMVSLQAAAGASLFAGGRTETALAALEQGLDESLRWAGRNSGLSALVALPLAEIAYEANDLARAEDLVRNHLPAARELSFADQLVAGHIVHARLHAARSDLANARRALDDAMTIALECDLERMRLAVIAEQVRLLLHNGMPEAAARRSAEAELPAHAQDFPPHPGATTRDELRAIIWVRMALSRDRIADALSVIKPWRSFCLQRGAVRSHVRWNILMAEALMLDGDGRAAQRVMREAIAAAAPANLIRCFVDEGAAVLSILSDAYADSMESQHPTDLFAKIVLQAFGTRRPSLASVPTSDEGLYGRLTGKELEILTLVGCGMRNREIGARLGLSEGSVKWYMQQVYDKVGIRRRSQAVERARQFGLIA